MRNAVLVLQLGDGWSAAVCGHMRCLFLSCVAGRQCCFATISVSMCSAGDGASVISDIQDIQDIFALCTAGRVAWNCYQCFVRAESWLCLALKRKCLVMLVLPCCVWTCESCRTADLCDCCLKNSWSTALNVVLPNE
jgi:hypothetical protein